MRPYSDRASFVGVQHTGFQTGNFATVEGPNPGYYGPLLSPVPYWNGYAFGQLVDLRQRRTRRTRAFVFPG